MKHSSFYATISALDAETSALDEETSALDAETPAIARSYQRYRRGVFGDIGDCGVGVTPQMCNRVTNHGDVGTFSKPVSCGVTGVDSVEGAHYTSMIPQSVQI